MFGLYRVAGTAILGGVCAIVGLSHAELARAATFKVLYTFCSAHNCADGAYPGLESLILDAKGNLYGTTESGGVNNGGAVYTLTQQGAETVLYSFPENGSIGYGPDSLVMDSKRILIGTTEMSANEGCGIAYGVEPHGLEVTRYTFTGPPKDGCNARGSLVLDADGNLFGTTSSGGKHRDAGIAFEIAKNGKETVLYDFCAKRYVCADGASPLGGLITDQSGNFYGTTEGGGSRRCDSGCGTIFELTPDGTETVLHAFKGSPNDGWGPSNLLEDQSGNFYGTTFDGGIMSNRCTIGGGCGIVFKLPPDGKETVLHYFKGGSDGFEPAAGLIEDSAGNLYGTTYWGGSDRYPCNSGCGTVFEVAPDGTETILYKFRDEADGEFPSAGLVADSSGNLYGTAAGGGAGEGVVYEITP
ncbi:MAG: choice-of-anchor tandem repeat GloVer-containing protein [Rhizomicrobium sp.]